MSFEKRQRTTDTSEQAARSTQQNTQSAAYTQSMPHRSEMGRKWSSKARAEQHFGMRIPDESTLQRLERNEQKYGRDTHEWIAEGMPAEIMGNPKKMEAFRQRQAERPPEVPANIERQNKRSVLRSEKAAGDTSTAGETGVPEPVRDVISSRGQSLDPSIQRTMEDRMGDSFGDVRIHTGSTAAEACESINARAFTVGNHIAFNAGEYDPESPEGQHVLAHELAHVRQQIEGAVSMLPQDDVELEVDPDPALEREAEEAAQQAMAEGPVVVNRMGCKMQIQRLSLGDNEPPQSTLEGFEDGEFDGSTTEKSVLEKLLAKLDPRGAARQSGSDTIEDIAYENDTVVTIAVNLLSLGVSGPVAGYTGSIEQAAGTHATAAAAIKTVGEEPIRNLTAASAGQVYDLLVDVGYSRLADVWQQAVERVRSSDDTGSTLEGKAKSRKEN